MWRKRPVGVTVLAVLLIGLGAMAWNYFSGPSSSDCDPVRELVAFNRTQTDLLNSKTKIPEQGSYGTATEPSDLDYRSWADGLTDRASKVTAPDLTDRAKSLAETAQRLVRARIDLNEKTKKIAPGGEPPPVAMAVTALYDQFQAELAQLTESCSG